MMENIKFSQADIAHVQHIIEKHEGEPWITCQGMRELWFRNGDSSAEFRLLFLFNMRLTVSRVAFKNRRTGTMSEIMTYCEKFARNNWVSKIVIQSVETPEMAQWCLKNGYQPNPSATIEIDGLLVGDYEKDISLA